MCAALLSTYNKKKHKNHFASLLRCHIFLLFSLSAASLLSAYNIVSSAIYGEWVRAARYQRFVEKTYFFFSFAFFLPSIPCSLGFFYYRIYWNSLFGVCSKRPKRQKSGDKSKRGERKKYVKKWSSSENLLSHLIHCFPDSTKINYTLYPQLTAAAAESPTLFMGKCSWDGCWWWWYY